MNSKYLFLYIIFILSTYAFYSIIKDWKIKNIQTQEHILVKQAQTHFNDQVNTRKWNSKYGGVYVKPLKGQKPNPYLKDNILKVDENLTLIKINPAWMTGQLSEQSHIKDFSFRITSLTPLNPTNIATDFETIALKYFQDTNNKFYYKFSENNTFNYMGALVTTASCIPCHKDQGYLLGDIRGGISIELNSSEYESIKSSLQKKALFAQILIFLFLLSITLLLRKQFIQTQALKDMINLRNLEINTTKQLLQNILDNDKSFLLVSNGTKIIFANKTLLDFAGFRTLDEMEENGFKISDKFEKIDTEEFLHPKMDGVHWIHYLKYQHNKKLKVLVKQDNENHYFKVNTKDITIDDELHQLITFDEITETYNKIEELKTEASTDPLTGLFNRRQLDSILTKEIELSIDTKRDLSIIFLDIDHFKVINDTYGHDVGDDILVEISQIITDTTRKNDFVSRWGGEEFMVTLQSTSLDEASDLAEKLRIKVKEHTFGCAGNISISLGVTSYEESESRDSFTKRVDEALYEAKGSGRNKVITK